MGATLQIPLGVSELEIAEELPDPTHNPADEAELPGVAESCLPKPGGSRLGRILANQSMSSGSGPNRWGCGN